MNKLIFTRYLWNFNAPADGDSTGSDAGSKSSTGTQKSENAEASVASLQGIEDISEDDLMGITADDDKTGDDKKSSTEEKSGDPGSLDDKSDSKKADDKKDDDTKTGDDKKVDDKKADDKTDDKKVDDKKNDTDEEVKVPKGYVKLEALKEARDENRFLKGEIAKLKVQAFELTTSQKPESTKLVTAEEEAEFKNFKPLSDAEFDEKFEDDQAGGLKYLKQLSKFQDFKQRQSEQKLNEEKFQRDLEAAATELQGIYDVTADAMEKILPGIFDDKTVQSELTEFAESIGFTEDMFYLTNPETRIILPGETKPLVLGEQAADILKMLTTARTKVGTNKPVDEAALRDTIKKEVEKELRPLIEKELLEKFKKGPDAKDDGVKTIDDIPSSEGEQRLSKDTVSEAEMAKWSDEEVEAYLSGRK